MWRDRSDTSITLKSFYLDIDSDEFKVIQRYAIEARAIELDSGKTTELKFDSIHKFVMFLDAIENDRWTRGGGGGHYFSGPTLEISSRYPFRITHNSVKNSTVSYHFTRGSSW
jgi:hypothetical protein